jgi:ABC-type Fe3+/spermidine/putrescine transport system ATPase subunit
VVRCGEIVLHTAVDPSVRAPSEVTVCIRPSAIRVTPTADGANADGVLRGRVVQRAYLGDNQDVRIELPGGMQIRALVPSRDQFQAADEVHVHFSPADCHIVAN